MRGDYIELIASRAKKPGSDPAATDDGPTDPPEGSTADLAKEKGSDYASVESDALDDLAQVLEVPQEAREDFDGALKELIEACVKRLGRG